MLVAAVIAPRGVCGQLLDAALDGRWQLVVSPQLLSELAAVLGREKFRRWLSQHEADRFVADVTAVADVRPDPVPVSGRMTADPKDEFLVALARTADVVALVSGDAHLTGLIDLDPPVLRPAAFLARLQESYEP